MSFRKFMSLRCGTRTHQNMFSLGVKDAMIGHQTFQVKQNHDTNFYTKTLKQKDWTVKTSSEKLTLTCVNMHVFCKSGFTSSITMKYWQEQDFQSLPVYMYISKRHGQKLALWSAKLQMFDD